MENDNNKLNCFIYCRVSTEEQAKEGYSIDAQKDICLKEAKRQHYNVLNTFVDEGQSATVSNRPEFLKMLEQVDTIKPAAIIVYNTDRFARNATDHFLIKERIKAVGTRLISVVQPMLDESPEGKMLDTFMAGINQFYSEDLSRKTKRGLDRKWEEGWWPGWAPLGYKNQRKNNKGIVVIDKKISPFITLAFKKYSTGNYSLFRLISFLSKKGLRTRTGKPLAHSTMNKILTNPFYYGLMQWKGQQKLGKHIPLISKRTFDLCQQVAAKHRNFIIRERKYDFLLRGVIFCDRCGQRYTAEYHYDNVKFAKWDGKYGIYHCAKRFPCDAPSVEVNELEGKVENYFQNIKFSKAFTNALVVKIKRYLKERKKEEDKERNRLMRRKNELTKKAEILLARLLDETIEPEDYKAQNPIIQNDIYCVNTELAKLDTNREFDFDLLSEVLSITRNIPKTYSNSPVFLKRRYLNFFFNRINVDNKNIVSVEYSPLVAELIKQKSLILTSNLLPVLDSIRTAVCGF